MGAGSIQGRRLSFSLAAAVLSWPLGRWRKTSDSVSHRAGAGRTVVELAGNSQDHAGSGRHLFCGSPPLLYSAAWLTSWREFSYNLVSILFLAFGLVTFTVFGVAGAAPWFLSGFDWRMGFVLGAVVAPHGRDCRYFNCQANGLPKRVVDILEGESLVNDASGLLALEFGIAMLVRGETATISTGLARLLYLTTAGLAVGLLIGVIVNWVEQRIDHGPIESPSALWCPT